MEEGREGRGANEGRRASAGLGMFQPAAGHWRQELASLVNPALVRDKLMPQVIICFRKSKEIVA